MPALVAVDALDATISYTLDTQTLAGSSLYAANYLRKKIFSKYTEDGNLSASSESHALDKFLRNCVRVKNHSITPTSMIEDELLGRFVFRSHQFFESIDIDEWSPRSLHELGGVGPGASIAAHGTDFLRKMYYGQVSCTSVDVLHSYLRGCRANPLDLEAAKCSLQDHGWYRDCSSRTSFVAKNVDEARTIATEPSLNMFFQLAIGKVINRALGRWYGFSVSKTPTVNREAAFRGSVDGSLSTIDLQSASDSISLQLVDLAIPGYLPELLERFRCKFTKLPDGRVLKLPMISTMGNGWTFSLMTALLYSALHAVCDVFGKPGDMRRCSVFGDDIIVPTLLYRNTVVILKLLGFIVNEEKSYSDGPFRESCGHDFYRGIYVRPVYIRRLDTTQSLYVAFNRIAEWGSFHNIYVNPILKALASPAKKVFVPSFSDYASGFRVPSTLSRCQEQGLFRYKRYEAVPLTYDVTESPVRVRTLDPRVNPSGVYVALIGGYLRTSSKTKIGKISERSEKKVLWRLTNRVTPTWDYRDSIPCPGWDEEAERRWKATVDWVLDD